MRPKLSAFEKAWMDAAADAIFPEQSLLPHGIARMHPARFFDEVLVEVPLEQAVGLRLTLWIVGLAPLFTIGRFGTIASISAPDRGRVLEALLATRVYVLRQLAMSFKAVITLLYVQSDDVRRAMSEPVRAAATGLVSSTRLVAGRRLESGHVAA